MQRDQPRDRPVGTRNGHELELGTQPRRLGCVRRGRETRAERLDPGERDGHLARRLLRQVVVRIDLVVRTLNPHETIEPNGADARQSHDQHDQRDEEARAERTGAKRHLISIDPPPGTLSQAVCGPEAGSAGGFCDVFQLPANVGERSSGRPSLERATSGRPIRQPVPACGPPLRRAVVRRLGNPFRGRPPPRGADDAGQEQRGGREPGDRDQRVQRADRVAEQADEAAGRRGTRRSRSRSPRPHAPRRTADRRPPHSCPPGSRGSSRAPTAPCRPARPPGIRRRPRAALRRRRSPRRRARSRGVRSDRARRARTSGPPSSPRGRSRARASRPRGTRRSRR